MAIILNFDIFQKILKIAMFWPKTSVTPLHIWFWVQWIHLWGYFSYLTKIMQKEMPKIALFWWNMVKTDLSGENWWPMFPSFIPLQTMFSSAVFVYMLHLSVLQTSSAFIEMNVLIDIGAIIDQVNKKWVLQIHF